MVDVITLRDDNTNFKRNCKYCNEEIVYCGTYAIYALKRAIKNNSKCNNCSRIGKKHSDETKEKISIGNKGKVISVEQRMNHSIKIKEYFSDNNNRKNTSNSVKKAWQNPEIRNKYIIGLKRIWTNVETRNKMIDALKQSKWLKVRCDIGQLEFLKKWDRLGFNFEPNYQLTDNNGFLAYLDGYDKEKNVVIEYDGNGHTLTKDLSRQNKIIELLKPKAFWRFNRKTKMLKNVSS